MFTNPLFRSPRRPPRAPGRRVGQRGRAVRACPRHRMAGSGPGGGGRALRGLQPLPRAPGGAARRRGVHPRRPRLPRALAAGARVLGVERDQPLAAHRRNPERAAAYYVALRGVFPGCTVTPPTCSTRRGRSATSGASRPPCPGRRPGCGGCTTTPTSTASATGEPEADHGAGARRDVADRDGRHLQLRARLPPDPARQPGRRGTRFTSRRQARIKRLYLYNWTGAPPGARFDAGLVGPTGTRGRRIGSSPSRPSGSPLARRDQRASCRDWAISSGRRGSTARRPPRRSPRARARAEGAQQEVVRLRGEGQRRAEVHGEVDGGGERRRLSGAGRPPATRRRRRTRPRSRRADAARPAAASRR